MHRTPTPLLTVSLPGPLGRAFWAAALALTGGMAASAQEIMLRTPGAEMTATASMSMSMTMEVYSADTVDECPTFPGGDRALLSFINATRQYPAEALEQRVQGRVLCGFVVMPDGEVSYPNVVRGVDSRLDAEALRIVRAMPRWVAGRHAGRAVPVYYVMPIIFRLQ